MPPDKRAYLKIIFLISEAKQVVGTQKNGTFEHPKHMLKLMG